MKSNILCILVLQPVVELLVVAEVESLLLKLPLQIPVRLCDEKKIRIRLFDARISQASTPSLAEDRLGFPTFARRSIQHKHRHIAADAIALIGDIGHRLEGSLSEPGLKNIQLQNIWPGWENMDPVRTRKHFLPR